MRCDIRVAQVFEMVEWKGIGKGYWGVYKNYIPKVPVHGKGTTWFGVFTRWSLDNKHCTETNCTLIFDLCVQSCTMATSRYYLKLSLCSSRHNNNNKTAAKFVLISSFLVRGLHYTSNTYPSCTPYTTTAKFCWHRVTSVTIMSAICRDVHDSTKLYYTDIFQHRNMVQVVTSSLMLI